MKKLTHDVFLNRILNIHDNKFKILGEYKIVKQKIIYELKDKLSNINMTIPSGKNTKLFI
ncbi:hypothetical protein [Clostridium sp. BJN0013]|uniref:hypothetical protein n=1 Tax=Clostridium sp. BJN0013 TaxID=3236840 RepID=UPI0034C5B6C3